VKIAILDLGTNTFNILIRDIEDETVLFSDKIAVKLGSGGIHKGFISEDAFQRGLDAMKVHRKTLDRYEVQIIKALATSAIRDASNGLDFTTEVKRTTGIEIEIIDGLEEARLIMQGVAQAMELPKEPVLVVDIGGGSTEFIISQDGDPFWMNSYPLGVSRLLEEFRPSDPIQTDEIERIDEHLDSFLQELVQECQKYSVRTMIGSSGSFDTLSDICQLKQDTDTTLSLDPSYLFDLAVYRMVQRDIIHATFEKRLAMPGMIPMRADMMVLSCLIIRWVQSHCGIQQMWGSRFALKEGVYFSLSKD
jgi:exopolyphosphatase/guanosine-5'-triphosphate,3'-diphosphate pyrophosphatase